jgi:hypothetical protein
MGAVPCIRKLAECPVNDTEGVMVQNGPSKSISHFRFGKRSGILM